MTTASGTITTACNMSIPTTRTRGRTPSSAWSAITEADGASGVGALQREGSAPRIEGLNHPTAAGHLHRTIDHGSAAGLYPLSRRRNTVDAEDIAPGRRGNIRRHGHDAAAVGAVVGEQLIDA